MSSDVQRIDDEPHATTVESLADHRSLVATIGDGPPVVLVHSLGLHHRMWRPVAQRLADDGRRAIAYDVRGHGTADTAPPATSVEQLADDLDRLLDRLEIPTCSVVGTSMGVAVALQFAVAHTERVRGLAVIAGLHRGFPALRERAVAGQEHGLPALHRPTLERWFGTDRVAADPAPVREARTALERFRLPHWVATWNALAELDVVDELERLTVPTVVVAGSEDASTPPAVMAEMVELLPGADQLHVVDGAPHLLAMTHPAELAGLLAALPR